MTITPGALMTVPAADAAAATNVHYELPPELFESFLDRRMKYTCALYPLRDATLDEAQETYLAAVADRLRLRGGERVLDVGCGWGSLSLFLAERFGCHVVGVTPSRTQAGHIVRRAAELGVADLVTVEHAPIQAVRLAARSFDAVAMVEVIEHLPEHREPLRKVYRSLRTGGRLFLAAFCYRTKAGKAEFEARPASVHALDLYGFTAMVPLSGLTAEIEDAGFSFTSLTDTTSHYECTMADWQERIAGNRERMEAVRPGFADEMYRYFDTARASWGQTSKAYALTAVKSRMGGFELP